MKPVNKEALYQTLNQLEVDTHQNDFVYYSVPKGKLLLLQCENIEYGPSVMKITGVLMQDGAGDDGDQELIEMMGTEEDIVFDMFLDNDTSDLANNFKLIDDPFVVM